MSKTSLDFKNFKHVKSDEHTTTLQHATQGHTITLMHAALSKANQAQLGALKGVAQQAQTPEQSAEMHEQKMADGGKVKNLAANPKSSPDKGNGKIIAIPGPELKNGKIIQMAEGGNVTQEPQDEPVKKDDPGAKVDKCQVVSSGGGFGKIIHCFATGGKVEIGDHKHVKFCPACGGGVVKMADGGDPFNVAQATQLDSSPSPLGPTPQEPDLSPEEKTYNFTEAAKESPLPSESGDDSSVTNMQGPEFITKHGATPEQFDSSAAKHAVAQAAWNKADKDSQAKQTQMEAAEKAQYAQAMGLQDPNAAPSGGQALNVSGATDEANAAQPDTAAGSQSKSSGGVDLNDPTARFNAATNLGMAGNTAEAKARGDLGEQQVQLYNNATEAAKKLQSDYQDQFKALDDERLAHIHDIENGHIDPNKYWTGDENGNGSHSKIAAGIGMILAGFNPTTNPNAATEFLKNQMEMNLKAQERNLSANENLLSANLRQFGNLKDAKDMTRIMLSDTLAHQLGAAAAKAQSPLAKAAALKAQSSLLMDSTPEAQNLSMRRMMMNMANNQKTGDTSQTEDQIRGMQMMGLPQGKMMAEAFVPGYGLTKSLNPVPAEVRSQLTDHNTVQTLGADLLDYAKNHTNLDPYSPEYARGAAKADAFQQVARKVVLSKTYRPGSQPMLEEIAQSGNPAGLMKNLKTIPKLESFLNSDRMEADTLAKSSGLPVPARQQAGVNHSPQAALQWAQSNPKDPRSAAILQRLGK